MKMVQQVGNCDIPEDAQGSLRTLFKLHMRAISCTKHGLLHSGSKDSHCVSSELMQEIGVALVKVMHTLQVEILNGIQSQILSFTSLLLKFVLRIIGQVSFGGGLHPQVATSGVEALADNPFLNFLPQWLQINPELKVRG